MSQLPQVSMSSGEVSPSMYARVDLARFLTSLRTCKDFIVRPQGGVCNRPGTQFIAHSKSDGQCKLIPFIFSVDQAYALEFGAGYIRCYTNGAPVSNGIVANITAVADGIIGFFARRTITTGTPHGLILGNQAIIEGVIGTGSFDINGVWTVLEVVSPTIFRVIGSGDPSGTYTSGGTVTLHVEVTTPYTVENLAELAYTQSADVLTVVHPSHPPFEFRRLSALSFQFAAVAFTKGPFDSLNEDVTSLVHASAVKGVVTLTSTKAIFTADHVGALFYMEQQDSVDTPPWEPGKRLAASGGGNSFNQRRSSDGKNYVCVTNFAPASNEVITGTIRPTHDSGVAPDGNGLAITSGAERSGVDWLYEDSGFGVVLITAFTDVNTVTATVLRRLPRACVGGAVLATGPYTMTGDGSDTTLSIAGSSRGNKYLYEVTFDGVIQDPESYSVDPITDILTFFTAPANGVAVSARELSQNRRSMLWAFGAWSEVNGYPGEVEFHGDRMIFAASTAAPQSLWMSEVSDYHNFLFSVPLVDDDAVSATLNARQLNAITELVPFESLLVLTKANEWKLTGGQDDVITPTSIGSKPQTANGAAKLPALLIGDSGLYVQDRGFKVRDLLFTIERDGYSGNEVSILSEHLLINKQIIDWTYQKLPFGVAWIVQDDGSLLGLTYLREHEVIGWHRHSVTGRVESICAIPEGNMDAVYLSVRRDFNGQVNRHIERMTNRFPSDPLDLIFMDSALTFDGRNVGLSTVALTGGTLWTVDEELTLTCTDPVFTASNVGDHIVLDYQGEFELRVEILSFTSTTVVKVQPLRDVPVFFQAAAVADWAFAKDTMGGLTHLETLTVAVIGDGKVQSQKTVVSGQITLDLPAVLVHIGLPIMADLETLDLAIPNGPSVRDRAKSITKLTLQVEETRGVFAGMDFDHLEEFSQRTNEDYVSAVDPKTGIMEVYLNNTWQKDGRTCIRQADPLPVSISAIIPEVTFGGSG